MRWTSEPPAGSFDGRLALVTGAGNGIGRATAQALAQAGATVVAVDRDAVAAAKTAADVGGVAESVDVGDAAAMAALADRVHAEHGPLDILVNNAGVGITGRFLDTSLEDWDWALDVNLKGIIHGCRFFGAAMVAAGRGHIVNVSSALGYTPRAGQPAYVTSKAAAFTLSRCLRADFAPHGVAVTDISPGVVNTGILDRTRFRGGHDSTRSRGAAARIFARGLAPDTVADAILDAVRKNKGVVPVGLDAKLGWLAHKVLPDAGVRAVAAFGAGVD